MGVDGIGGAGPLGPGGPGPGGGVDGPASPGGAAGAEKGRAAERAHAADGASAADATARADGPVDVSGARLEAGELGIDAYLEAQVEQATAHLVERLPEAALELVRDELREQLAADPLLRALTEQALGRGGGAPGSGR